MDGKTWLWLILALVVIAVIVFAVVMSGRRRTTKQAEQAQSLRQEASEHSTLVKQRESKAAEVDARARAAQAESDAKAAEADRLALTAERQKAEAQQERSEVDDQFHKANEIDPHYDSTDDEVGAATDGSEESQPQGMSTSDERERETPR